MWDLENKTPFAAERVVLQDTDGADVWIVAVRGTFTLQLGGSVELAEEQQPVCLIPEYTGEAGRSSLRCDDDLVLTKVTTDVLLHGHAFTPEGRPADQVRVRLCVGTVDKTLLVVGDCVFKGGAGEVEPGPPQPFVKMPMVYERAWGGAEEGDWGLEGIPANPIGVGFGDPGRLEGTRAPNVLYPDRGDTRPAGFGPIPRECSPRREYAGTYDENWRRRRQPLLALDLDRRFFQCAPEDQQPPTFLQGGEQVELHNLTPGGLLRFSLPRAEIAFCTDLDGDTVEHQGHLHTVLMEPDRMRLQLVWHTRLACHGKAHLIRTTSISA